MEAQNKMLRRWFGEGRRITQPIAMRELLIGRLASRINDLRNEGVIIQDRFVDYRRADNKVVRVKEYWIDKTITTRKTKKKK